MSKRPREDNVDPSYNENTSTTSSITCNMPPCVAVTFNNYYDYESHIIQHHNHKCLQCQKRFPSTAILDIHIEENHSMLWTIRVERGDKVFKCFECTKLCLSAQKRRLHLIDKHNYPKQFHYNIINTGL